MYSPTIINYLKFAEFGESVVSLSNILCLRLKIKSLEKKGYSLILCKLLKCFACFILALLCPKLIFIFPPVIKLRLIFGEREKGGENTYTHARFGEPA